MSKVFSFTPDYPYYVNANEVVKGGSGYAIKTVEMIKKLAAVKALAENGVGGEKETASRMYKDLKAKYGITDGEVAAVKEPAAAEVKKEFSDIAFAMWVLASNLDEEMRICWDYCPYSDKKEMCAECATNANIKDLKAQYEELMAQFESGGNNNG